MCALFDTYGYSFKWISSLVVITGIYTFLHWFLAVPLLYFHFYECCNEKWAGNWVVWFLVSSLGCWIGLFLLILLIWCCLRLLFVRHLNDSNVHLIKKKHAKHPDVMINEKTMARIAEKNFNKHVEYKEEIVVLPDFNPKGSFNILQMNDVQTENSVPETNLEISAHETLVHIQNENGREKKTSRDIFFKDLIKGNSDSYFDFDSDKISKFKSKCENMDTDEKDVQGNCKNENLTSELMASLNEKGLAMDGRVFVE